MGIWSTRQWNIAQKEGLYCRLYINKFLTPCGVVSILISLFCHYMKGSLELSLSRDFGVFCFCFFLFSVMLYQTIWRRSTIFSPDSCESANVTLQQEKVLLVLESPVNLFNCLLLLLSNTEAKWCVHHKAISLIHPSDWLLEAFGESSI